MEISIKLTIDQVNTVLGALAKLPYEQVADLLGNIRHQAQQQVDAAQASHSVQEEGGEPA
ncbi:hypothetical protein [Geobacter sp. SVR]|uniref:hypothetical protein n=1 Tax=Geobacter sp. SVR TaxID=2495594 RepID=UPI00143EFFAC|nr:hypothetical protein [Geobacter sp. SVR]BCS54088.1 hypothetical protein GSVR_23960 [Geobacter sp. SVR]GCF87571.1 hypothetical protein GSbR_41710 [Geobacter sp. SVR]